MYPAQRAGAVATDGSNVIVAPGTASLSSCLKSLYEIWNKYEFGLESNKAAKDFTSANMVKLNFNTAKERYFGTKY